jgi:hypothetical protein
MLGDKNERRVKREKRKLPEFLAHGGTEHAEKRRVDV